MRLLHVTAGNLFGGIERMVLDLAAADGGTLTNDVAVCFEGRLAGELRRAGRVPHVIGGAHFSMPPTVWRARRMLGRTVREGGYDAVVFHAPWSYALGAEAVEGDVLRLLWMHDAPQPDHWIERRATRQPPHGLICNSRWTDERAGAWLPRLPRWIIHPPVAAPAADALVRARVRSQLGATGRSVIILSASRMERWKGHARLVRAAARLHGDTRVWIAGGPQRPHERGYLRELRRVVHEAGLDARVSFLGERDDVPSLMQAADIVCQPNVTPEPFGIAFVEALYAARPVVTTALGGAVEIVSPECGILLAPDDDAGLAAALQHLVDDEPLRRSLGAPGPPRARALCDPAAQAARLSAVVRSFRMEPAEARC